MREIWGGMTAYQIAQAVNAPDSHTRLQEHSIDSINTLCKTLDKEDISGLVSRSVSEVVKGSG